MKLTKRICAGVLIGIVCLGLLCIPRIWAFVAEKSFLGSTTPRPSQNLLLSERARRIPALYAVHAADMLPLPLLPNAAVDWQAAEDPARELETFLCVADDLEHAGVLTHSDRTALEEVLADEQRYLRTAQNDLFSYLSRGYDAGLLYPVRQFFCCVHTESGLALTVTLPLEAGQSADDMLHAYLDYLGLDVLGDWQEITPPVSEFSEGKGAAMWSAEGQVYLYCAKQPQETTIGITAMSEDDVRAFF